MRVERDVTLEGKALRVLVEGKKHTEILRGFNSLLDKIEELNEKLSSYKELGFITRMEMDSMNQLPKVAFSGFSTSEKLLPYGNYRVFFREGDVV